MDPCINGSYGSRILPHDPTIREISPLWGFAILIVLNPAIPRRVTYLRGHKVGMTASCQLMIHLLYPPTILDLTIEKGLKGSLDRWPTLLHDFEIHGFRPFNTFLLP
jgi:hypothetical protein